MFKRTAHCPSHKAPRSYRLARLRAVALSEDGAWFGLLGLSAVGAGLLLGADGVWRLVSTIVRSVWTLVF